MSIALNDYVESYKDMAKAMAEEILIEGTPWGRGFAIGLAIALMIVLPLSLLFVYALVGGPWNHRHAPTATAVNTRNVSEFASTPYTDPGSRNYLSTEL